MATPARGPIAASQHQLTPGPTWHSFEQFRKGGPSALEAIAHGEAATLETKSSTFRILRDPDFQSLIGLASEVHRTQSALRLIIQTAELFEKHPDAEHARLLLSIAQQFRATNPLASGNAAPFEITEEEAAALQDDDFDPAVSPVHRPAL